MKSLLLFASLTAAAVSAATVSSPSAPAPLTSSASFVEGSSGSYTVDGGHSSVVFATKHLGVSRFYGRFNEVSGSLELNEDDLGQSSITLEIPTASVDSNSEQRDGHLKSPDFFSAKEFPVITFESSTIRGTRDAFEIDGELTLRGVTKTITAKGGFVGAGDTMFGDYRCGFEARFTIAAADYGVPFMKERPNAVGPEVEVIVSLECVRG